MSYGATDDPNAPLKSDDGMVVDSQDGGDGCFMGLYNMIPSAFPFFATIIWGIEVVTIYNCKSDIDTVVDDGRDAGITHIDVVNGFQGHMMTIYYWSAAVNACVLFGLYCTMGTGMQRFCNMLDHYEDHHNFGGKTDANGKVISKGLTAWIIFWVERLEELLVVLDYILVFCILGMYLVWVTGYFTTSIFDGSCDYDDSTRDLLDILCSDVSFHFCDINDIAVLCDKIVGINDDTATVMVDSMIIAICQLLFMLLVVELHKKSQHVMHDHMFTDDDIDLITGVHALPQTTVVSDDEEEDDDAPSAAVVEDAPPAEEEEEEVDDKEDMEDEEEVM